MTGSNRQYGFDFVDPHYVESIEISLTGYAKGRGLEFTWVDAFNLSHKQKQKIDTETLSFDVNCVIKSFSFIPNKQFSGKQSIRYVVVYGYTQPDFLTVCEGVSNINNAMVDLNNALEELNKKEVMATTNVTTAETQLHQLNIELESLSKQQEMEKEALEIWTADVSIAATKLDKTNVEIKDRNTTLNDLGDQESVKAEHINSLNSDMSDLKSALRKLKDEINIYPSEYSGFIKQSRADLRTYFMLAAVPMVLIAVYSFYFFMGAVELTTIYYKIMGFDISTVLLSRIPFVVISVFVIHASFSYSKSFFAQLVRVNQQRLELAKIGIIANDVSDTSTIRLQIDQSQIYELKTKLKMDLIKSHLKSTIGDDYNYNVAPSLLEKFLERKKGKESKGE